MVQTTELFCQGHTNSIFTTFERNRQVSRLCETSCYKWTWNENCWFMHFNGRISWEKFKEIIRSWAIFVSVSQTLKGTKISDFATFGNVHFINTIIIIRIFACIWNQLGDFGQQGWSQRGILANKAATITKQRLPDVTETWEELAVIFLNKFRILNFNWFSCQICKCSYFFNCSERRYGDRILSSILLPQRRSLCYIAVLHSYIVWYDIASDV